MAVALLAASCGSSEDPDQHSVREDGGGVTVPEPTAGGNDPYRDRVIERFADGQIMDEAQATCVADGVDGLIDWEAVSDRGFEPADVFGSTPLLDQISSGEVDVLLDAIETCRGTDSVVLAIFGLQLDLEGDQIGCLATTITPDSAHDVLRLILTGDQPTFLGSGGEVLLAACSP